MFQTNDSNPFVFESLGNFSSPVIRSIVNDDHLPLRFRLSQNAADAVANERGVPIRGGQHTHFGHGYLSRISSDVDVPYIHFPEL